MKLLGLIAIMFSSSVFAYGLEISSFEIVRWGAGSKTAVVSKNIDNNTIVVKTTKCQGPMSSDEIEAGEFALTGELAEKAKAILNRKATIGQYVKLESLPIPTGTWVKLKINTVETGFADELITNTVEVNKPLVLIDGKVDTVISEIESEIHERVEACK